MNRLNILLLIVNMWLILSVSASNLDKVLVYSSEQSNGSVSIGKRWAYTKNLEINVVNMSNSDLDLSKLCFRATSPENKEFKLDTIDEKLTSSVLKPKQFLRGSLAFSSDSTSIHKTVLIKISDKCGNF